MTSLQPTGTMSRFPARALACIVLSCAAVGQVMAQSIKPGDIAPFEVVYEVGNNLLSAGTARLTLTTSGDLWHYSLNTRPKGVFKLAGKGEISELSTFRIVKSDAGVELQPQIYRYRQDEERRREVDATFDWDKRSLTHVYRGQTATESFTDPVLDRLTVTLVIMNALRNDFDRAELAVFDSGKIKQVEFINEGSEILNTPLGDIETYRVINRNATGGSRETTTWIAPSLDYLPVKIEHRKRRELVARLSLLSLDNRVTSIELGGAIPEEADAQALPLEAGTGEEGTGDADNGAGDAVAEPVKAE
ncbi:MAG: DUF3108 domain-containing protein [Granulosicoccus sp.]|nr:DUF3108 domain-containing protein [Granulosicoccus sp.]